MSTDLRGQVALVTGASRGIGQAIALALGRAGAAVVGTATTQGGAQGISAALAAAGIGGRGAALDVGDPAGIDALIAAIEQELGAVSILVNNAGITRDKTFVKMTYDIWKEVLDVDLTGPAMVTHEVLRDMLEHGWGRIVFITSIVGQMGNFGQSNYAVAKGGLISLTRTLAREVARKGITVNAVAPGFIETDMTSAVPPDVLDNIRKTTPIGRLGKPEEVAEAVRFLVAPQAAFITGEVLNVNGGLYMG